MKRLRIWLSIFSVLLMILGFNTLDWMMNRYYWNQSNPDPFWHMNTWFVWDWYNCYLWFGVLSLMFGSLFFGYLLKGDEKNE